MVKRFGDSLFKIGSDDDKKSLKVTLKEYLEYSTFNRDDSPMYLFQSNIDYHAKAHAMSKEYKPPHYFRQNLFMEMLGDVKAPPNRWFLMGPKRSGSCMHQDPLGTSAWNTSVCGHKRWVLMPPGEGIDKKLVRGQHLLQPGEDDEAI